ncbi:SMI1/KNR4 family protein [Nodosilinea sp. LEGE 07088]|uniref:SMI1/KNR4 family protein n=1 Tax=Nodosilinea sp. LEGE 07088 TaxID=2777968 RepID=UPI00187E72B8|nr:SMI1/KNR4 family protein [Nodosilinea sp. LEGE 07088]MBE9138492.1 SMI1/KNR4 family protein [Nodosilinea sp. LEGE 07088]
MSSFNWERFLKRWSQEIIDAIGPDSADLPPGVLKSGWLGYAGATEKQLSRAEARLERSLPPSYRAFLKVTNGWRQTPLFSNTLWSIEDVEWFAVRHQAWINAFLEQAEPHSPVTANAKAPTPSVSDADYFIYGDAQDCSQLRLDYLQTTLEISQPSDGAIYLLNPQVVTPDGEWEAWFFGDWLPGADRYPSFQIMMQAEYENFLELRDTPDGPAFSAITPEPVTPEPEETNPSPTVIEATASLSVVSPEPDELDELAIDGSSALMPPLIPPLTEAWHDWASFTVEFQACRDQQRSTAHHRETGAAETWSDIDPGAVQAWMFQQLKATPDQSTSETPVALDITQLRVLRSRPVDSPMVADRAQPLFPGTIQSGEPFILEVSMNVVGEARASLAEQQLVYRAQCVAHHLSTQLDTKLGDITLHMAGRNDPPYTAQFPEARLLQPGLYRLKVWVTLQNVSASPGYFKVPVLQVV